jgi:sec-independent protein translocase protein TatA
MPIGPLELGIVLLVVLLIFGPKRLPGLGKQLGSGMREFKEGITGDSKDDKKDDQRPEITSAQASSTQSSAETEDAPSRS